MAEEIGIRDVLQQARLNGLKQNAREMRLGIEARFDCVNREIGTLRHAILSEIATQGRWRVGLIFASWLTLMASFWLKLKCGDIAEELGTRDVLKQVDTRPSNVVGDIRGLRSGTDDRLNQMEVPVNQPS